MPDDTARTGRMVVLGTDRLTMPLAAIGFEPVHCTSPSELEKALKKLGRRPDVVLVVCGESQAVGVPEAIASFRAGTTGILMLLPDTVEGRRLDAEMLRGAVEQAAGVDLLGKELKKT